MRISFIETKKHSPNTEFVGADRAGADPLHVGGLHGCGHTWGTPPYAEPLYRNQETQP